MEDLVFHAVIAIGIGVTIVTVALSVWGVRALIRWARARGRQGFHSWRESPMIRMALQSREPEDIHVVHCDRCGSVVYYNCGSHCTCEWCDARLDHLLEPDLGEVLTLEDVIESEIETEDLP